MDSCVRARAAIVCCFLSAISGCKAHQVERDGVSFRTALLNIYEEQSFDNLVRARTFRPYVQVAYHDLLVQEVDMVSGMITNTNSGEKDPTKTIAAGVATQMFAKKLSNSFGLQGNASRQGTLSFHADPITDKNDIYEHYQAFAFNPQLLKISEHRPEGKIHYVRKHEGRYYWIPCEAEPAFQDLVMVTSFRRGIESVPPAFYEVQIVDIKEIPPDPLSPLPQGFEGTLIAEIYFNNPVPNGESRLVATLDDGRKVQLRMSPVQHAASGDKEQNLPIPGTPVNWLNTSWNPQLTKFTSLNLIGSTARIYSDNFPPPVVNTQSIEKKIYNDVDRIRAATTTMSNPK